MTCLIENDGRWTMHRGEKMQSNRLLQKNMLQSVVCSTHAPSESVKPALRFLPYPPRKVGAAAQYSAHA